MTTTILSNDEANKIIEDLRAAKRSIRMFQDEEEKLKQKLYNFMGEHDILIDHETGEESVKWTYSEGYMKFDAKKFMADKPKVYAKYCSKTEPVRTLRISK